MNGRQLELLSTALCDAYDWDSLRQLLRFRLDKDLQSITARTDLRTVTFDLMESALHGGWLDVLIREAHDYRPDNALLRQFFHAHTRGGSKADDSGRPALRTCLLENRIANEGTNGYSSEDREFHFVADLAVVNQRALPNGLLGVRFWLALAGGVWQEANTCRVKSKTFPINIPPMESVSLPLWVAITLPVIPEAEAVRGDWEFLEAYLGRSLARPVAMRVELRSLSDERFTDVLVCAQPGVRFRGGVVGEEPPETTTSS